MPSSVRQHLAWTRGCGTRTPMSSATRCGNCGGTAAGFRSTFAPPDARTRGTGQNGRGRQGTAQATDRPFVHVTGDDRAWWGWEGTRGETALRPVKSLASLTQVRAPFLSAEIRTCAVGGASHHSARLRWYLAGSGISVVVSGTDVLSRVWLAPCRRSRPDPENMRRAVTRPTPCLPARWPPRGCRQQGRPTRHPCPCRPRLARSTAPRPRFGAATCVRGVSGRPGPGSPEPSPPSTNTGPQPYKEILNSTTGHQRTHHGAGS